MALMNMDYLWPLTRCYCHEFHGPFAITEALPNFDTNSLTPAHVVYTYLLFLFVLANSL
jgi:hypothetical protein